MPLPVAALAIVLALAGCRRADRVTSDSTGPAVAVTQARVSAEALPLRLEVPATVRPAERAVIAAKLTGTIASFRLGLGESVHAGDVLLTISAPETEARVRQTQAQLAEAQRNAERTRALVASGVSASESFRDAEDRLRFVQASVAEAEAMLAYATVRAPFDGVVTEKHALTGDLAGPGVPLLVLESVQHLRAEGTIPERNAAILHLGDSIEVWLEDGAAPVAGRIEELSAAADAVSRSVLAKVTLPAGAARSGQFGRLLVPAGTSPALLVPVAAVASFGQIDRVFVVEQGRAVLRIVKVGRTAGDRVEILAGLQANETVIVAPPAALRDGSPVALQP
ncbi:MAG TPA: efflux RND transporter periplasmic adaptor subunit [Candidatus Didemnitutus sp.]|nr:efflux RND transporter periplasmic adaptor subunit [Candidatus Didemnitutus sp.]